MEDFRSWLWDGHWLRSETNKKKSSYHFYIQERLKNTLKCSTIKIDTESGSRLQFCQKRQFTIKSFSSQVLMVPPAPSHWMSPLGRPTRAQEHCLVGWGLKKSRGPLLNRTLIPHCQTASRTDAGHWRMPPRACKGVHCKNELMNEVKWKREAGKTDLSAHLCIIL